MITLSPDGKYIALGEGRAGLGIAQLFDAKTGRAIFAFEYRNSVASLAFSPDSSRLLIGSTDNTAELRSVPSGQFIGQPLVHAASIYHVGFAPDGQSFAIAQDGGMIRVWALPRQRASSFRVALDGMYSFAEVTPDGKYLLPTGMNQMRCTLAGTRVYELATGKPAGPLLRPGGVMMGAAFAPDGRHVAILSGRSKQPSRVHFYDWRTGLSALDPVPLPSEPRSLSFTPDGRRLAIYCAGGELLILDSASGHLAAQWQALRQLSEAQHYINGNGAIRFGPDGRTLFVWGLITKVSAFDIETGKVRFELVHECAVSQRALLAGRAACRHRVIRPESTHLELCDRRAGGRADPAS